MDIVERLRMAATTATNDDVTHPSSEKRKRHVARVDALLAGADEIERLRAALQKIKDQCERGGPRDTYNAAVHALEQAAREHDPNVAPCDDAEFGMKP